MYRLLWRLGIKATPPLFSSFIIVFILHAIYFAVVLGLMMCAIFWRKQNLSFESIALSACLAGMLFGLFMAFFIKLRSKKYHLPSWKDYGNA